MMQLLMTNCHYKTAEYAVKWRKKYWNCFPNTYLKLWLTRTSLKNASLTEVKNVQRTVLKGIM